MVSYFSGSVKPVRVSRTPCKFFAAGNCRKGQSCTFTHGEDDRRGESGSELPEVGGELPELGGELDSQLLELSRELGGELPEDNAGDELDAELLKLLESGGELGGELLEEPAFAWGPERRSHERLETKRTLCKFFQEGTCRRGNSCGFAHGEEEIGQVIEPSRTLSLSSGAAVPATHIGGAGVASSKKRTACKFWLAGKCKSGTHCTFAHGEHRIAKAIEPPAVDIKRTLCKFFAEGACAKGSACGFAHGEEELGTPVDAIAGFQGVKRTMCKFFLQGGCDRGELCGWAHGENEIGEVIPAASEQRQGRVKSDRPTSRSYTSGQYALEVAAAPPVDEECYAQEAVDEEEVIPAAVEEWQGPATPDRPPSRSYTSGQYALEVAAAPSVDEEYLAQAAEELDRRHLQQQQQQQQQYSQPRRFHEQPRAALANERPSFTSRVKRTMCRFFLKGDCSKGRQCGYAHGEEDLGKPIYSAPGGAPPAAFWSGATPVPAKSRASSVATPVAAAKRAMCAYWEEGRCKKGDACEFAHGEREMLFFMAGHVAAKRARVAP